MNNTTRTVLIALGIALLVVVLLPLLFMAGMMSMMGGMMGHMMNGAPGPMMGGMSMSWVMVALVLLVLLAGVGLLVVGLRHR